MDASEQLASYFELLIERCNRAPMGRPDGFPRHDRIIYYIVSTRCEMDINGFASVFDQLLDEGELQFLIESLYEVKADKLASHFARAYTQLSAAGFYKDDSAMVGDRKAIAGILDRIEEDIREHDALWELDVRLAALIPD